MDSAKKTIRRYIGIKKTWKAAMALLAALCIVLAVLSAFTGNQPEPEPVLFDPMSASRNDYCYFDAVGLSEWLYKVETKNGSYTSYDTYYVAMDADGYWIIVDLPMGEQTNMFAQSLYFNGASLDDSMPEPYRITGLAVPMREGNEIRENIAGVIGIDDGDEFERYFGNMLLSAGGSPKKNGSAKLEAAAIFAGLIAFMILMANLGSTAGAALRELSKHGALEAAAEQLERYDISGGMDPVIVGEGYVFLKNKGVALCPGSVRDAVWDGTSVSLKTDLRPKPIVLWFNDEGKAGDFIRHIPGELVTVVDTEEEIVLPDSIEKE